MEGEVWQIIERRWAARPVQKSDGTTVLAEYVFHRQGRRVVDFSKAWSAACARAGVPGRIFHDLRRTAVRNMVRAGVPEPVAMAITGHRTLSVFLRYNIASETEKREAIRKVEAHLASLPASSNLEQMTSRAGSN